MKIFSDTDYGDLSGQVFRGNLSIPDRDINNLEGCPYEVLGHFNAWSNRLKTLDFAPKVIHDDAFFMDNKLVNLKGSLEKVHGDLYLSRNPLLESFKGNLRYVRGNLYIYRLPFFKSLEQIKEAIEDAGIVIGGEICTSFGVFEQKQKDIK